jgi:hypothetical protein
VFGAFLSRLRRRRDQRADEFAHMSRSERRLTSERVEDIQADAFVNEHLSPGSPRDSEQLPSD